MSFNVDLYTKLYQSHDIVIAANPYVNTSGHQPLRFLASPMQVTIVVIHSSGSISQAYLTSLCLRKT